MEIKQAEKILKALANRRRLAIVKFLKRARKASVTEIASHIKLSVKATSKHLSILKNADIVEAEQVSLVRFYFLTSPQNPITKAAITTL